MCKNVFVNTRNSFHNQHLQFCHLIGTAKTLLTIYTDKEYETETITLTETELNTHNTSMFRKLQFFTDYMKKLNNIQTEVAWEDDKNWEIDALIAELEKMDADLQKRNQEYSTWFKEFEQSTIVTPGAKGATGGNTRSNTSPTIVLVIPIAPYIRGNAESVKLDKLTPDITTDEINWWIENWESYKVASAFRA